MEDYFRAVALTLTALMLILSLKSGAKGVAELLALALGVMVLTLALRYLQPVADLLGQIRSLGALSDEMLQIVLKAVGISVTAEIATLLCEDCANAALGKSLQFLATAVILCLSVPMLTALLELVEQILERI